MMIVDIRKLNAQKKYTGRLELSYSFPESLIEIPFVKIDGDVKVVFDYELYQDDSFEIVGKVSYRLVGQCSRCLKDASKTVEGELNALFEDREDFEDYPYTNGVVDLTKAIEDAVLLSMPFSLSCGDDCKGISY